MIKIDNVEYSKNPVNVGEVLFISVTVHEEIATWEDVKVAKWSDIFKATWDKVKRKIF